MNKEISASILSADFTRLGEEIEAVVKAGADMIHVDVMDNHYVPNLTIGPCVAHSIRKHFSAVFMDVHLMVKPVDCLIEEFAKAGANSITVHPESTHHLDRTLQLIRDLGCKVGLSLNPTTSLTVLDYVWEKIDLILLMTVNPGFGGQAFIDSMIPKIQLTRALIDEKNLPIRLQVDGGITEKNIRAIANAGADLFVCGSGIFKSNNYQKTIAAMKSQL